MNYKELLYNKDAALTFFPRLAVIFNKYDDIESERIFCETGEKRKSDKSGLSKAIVINQLNYWLGINQKSGNNFRDGYYWTYNTYQMWADNDFVFWSADTVKRVFTSLEKIGVVVSTSAYNKLGLDKTKWYRIDYDRLQEIIDTVEEYEKSRSVQPASSKRATCTVEEGNVPRRGGQPAPSNTIDYTETSSETTSESMRVCSFSGEKEVSPSSEGGTLSPTVTKAIDEAMTEEGESTDSFCRAELKDIAEYFVSEYARTQGKPHKPLTRPAISNIVYNYLHQDEDEYGIMDDVLTLDQYIPLIDMYMQTNYREGIEKSLSHFMSGSIRRNLKAKLIE